MTEENKYKFIITKEWEGQRIVFVLASLMEDCSRSFIQRLIEGGSVSVANKVCTSKKEKLKEGSEIELLMPPPKALDAQPEDIPLDIVYEDDQLIVVNKPRGMVVHPAAGNESGTLVNALLFHCGKMSVINGVERPGIVHRIDKDTSGLLVCAKTDVAHNGLSEQLAVHSVTRRYVGICVGNLKEAEFTVDAPIARDPKNRLRMAVVPDGKRAVTHIKELEAFNGCSLFEARLETGRTHQIRVHMAYKNHPLLGDTVYGPAKQPYGLNGQMLHAKVLGFIHPVSGKYLEFSAEPPADFQEVLEKVRKK